MYEVSDLQICRVVSACLIRHELKCILNNKLFIAYDFHGVLCFCYHHLLSLPMCAEQYFAITIIQPCVWFVYSTNGFTAFPTWWVTDICTPTKCTIKIRKSIEEVYFLLLLWIFLVKVKFYLFIYFKNIFRKKQYIYIFKTSTCFIALLWKALIAHIDNRFPRMYYKHVVVSAISWNVIKLGFIRFAMFYCFHEK